MSFDQLVEDCCTQLRRRQLEGSYPCARRTAELLRALVSSRRHPDASALLADVRSVGARLQQAKPAELAIGNVVRRVLHAVREEAAAEESERGADAGAREDAEAAAAAAAAAAAPPPPPARPPLPPGGLGSRLGGGGGGGAAGAAAGRGSGGQGSGAGGGAGGGGGSSGLLTQALRPGGAGGGAFGGPAGRVLSLSNLLESGAAGGGAGGADDAAPAPPKPPVPAPPAPVPPPQAKPTSASSSSAAARRGRAAAWSRRDHVIEAINDLIDDLEGTDGHIAAQAPDHVHAAEVILTHGGASRAVAAFLREAARRRAYRLVVAEAAPRYDGHALARQLASAGVPTTLVADSAVYALMARVNKVVVGAHAVLANGGVLAPSGAMAVALAARRHSVPLVVLAGLHKLSPLFPHDPDAALNEFQAPGAVADADVLAEAFSAGLRLHAEAVEAAAAAQAAAAAGVGGAAGGSAASGGSAAPPPPAPLVRQLDVDVVNPAYDYIPPELVSLLVTDVGGYTPSYVYRLLSEYYSREDYVLPGVSGGGGGAGAAGGGGGGLGIGTESAARGGGGGAVLLGGGSGAGGGGGGASSAAASAAAAAVVAVA
jgi:translation initiation factor eIF-2B subunit beta